MECIGYIKELKKFSQSVNSKKNSKNRIVKETWHWQITNHSATHHSSQYLKSSDNRAMDAFTKGDISKNKIYMILW